MSVPSLEHERAVGTLLDTYAAVPPDRPVRLAKATSNLFRPRATTGTPGLDTTGLGHVLRVDPTTRMADVQGMCTYEQLVEATLAHGLMPLVVPQLRTITLGGAVAGLGIESTSFRHGLPHESVLEMDVLTGAGKIITATPDGEHADLFAAFPNSYGSLGYATRLRIELQPVERFVALRNVRFMALDELVTAVDEVMSTGRWAGERVDAMDGVMFAPGEAYLVLGRWSDVPTRTSDYTGQSIYYRSLRARGADALTIGDYLWRWDTDWFWCSGAFGVQNPVLRRLWPKRYRRSDVYHRLVRLEQRLASRPGSTACAEHPVASGWSRTSRSRSSAPPSSCAGSSSTSRCHRSGSARCGCANPTAGGPRAGGRSSRCSRAAGT